MSHSVRATQTPTSLSQTHVVFRWCVKSKKPSIVVADGKTRLSSVKNRNIRIHIILIFAFSHLILPNQPLLHVLLILLLLLLIQFLLFHNHRPRRGVEPHLLRLRWRRFMFMRGRRWCRRGAFGTRTDTLAGGSLRTGTRTEIGAWLYISANAHAHARRRRRRRRRRFNVIGVHVLKSLP